MDEAERKRLAAEWLDNEAELKRCYDLAVGVPNPIDRAADLEARQDEIEAELGEEWSERRRAELISDELAAMKDEGLIDLSTDGPIKGDTVASLTPEGRAWIDEFTAAIGREVGRTVQPQEIQAAFVQLMKEMGADYELTDPPTLARLLAILRGQ